MTAQPNVETFCLLRRLKLANSTFATYTGEPQCRRDNGSDALSSRRLVKYCEKFVR